jgi:hypothetical protein
VLPNDFPAGKDKVKDSILPENRGFDQPSLGSERSFGFLFAAVFTAIGLWPLTNGSTVRIWPLCLAAFLVLSALFAPWLLRPLNEWWFRFGLGLGKVVTPVVMGILFYLTITPLALLMRALGKDPLRLKRDVAAPTYWLPRSPAGPQRGSLRDQF